MALTDNILAYWNLNNDGSGGINLVDATGNGNDLTNNNGVSLGSGIIGGDAVFNGSNNLSTTATFSGSYPLSYSAWVNYSGSGPWCGLGTYPSNFRLLGIDGDLYFQAPDSTVANTTGGSYNDGNWHYVVGIADGTNIYLYVDGSLAATTANSSTGSGNPFLIGNGGDFFSPDGSQIDEVGVWSRALSSTEVYDLYYGGLGNTYPFTNPLPVPLTVGCKSYWNLNDNGSGGVSLVDSTGNGNDLTNNGGVTLGSGKIEGGAVFNGSDNLSTGFTYNPNGSFSCFSWVYPTQFGGAPYNINAVFWADSSVGQELRVDQDGYLISIINDGGAFPSATSASPLPLNEWSFVGCIRDASTKTFSVYVNGVQSGNVANYTSNDFWNSGPTTIGSDSTNMVGWYGTIDEVGFWSRVLSDSDIASLYNSGAGRTYPFTTLYYNNAENDGDWGNLLNWWQDYGFTIQATALPTSTNSVNLYNQVTQNTLGADQCFCASASFWSADFGVGLTLQSTGVVNMQGTSVMAGTTTDSVSMHDSSTLTDTSVVDGNVTMRDSSRAFGTVLGNATVYYDGGNGQFPIGGTVGGTVTYLGWPAITPQWFNDKATGGGNDGDFSNKVNWWTNNTYTTRPINAEGTQELPDASTDVFIAPNTGIVANSGTANPTVNSVTANNSNIQNISITATNGFLFSGNEGVANAVLYGNVIFQDTAYNDHAVIQGKATYKSAASLQYSWGQNSLGNVNAGMYNGSTAFEVDIAGGGGGNGGFISRLLNLPWFIRF